MASRDLQPLEFSFYVKEKLLFCLSLFIAYVISIVLTCYICLKDYLSTNLFILPILEGNPSGIH